MKTSLQKSVSIKSIQCHNRTQLSDFPKNFALLQLILQKVVSTSQKTIQSVAVTQPYLEIFQEDSLSVYTILNQLAYDRSSSSNSEKPFFPNSSFATRQKLVDDFIKKQLKNKNLSPDALSDNYSNQAERCVIHRKKREILCIECKLQVCSNCALFGEHKLHDVTPVVDAVQQITKTVDSLIVLFKKVELAKIEILDESFNSTVKRHLNDHLIDLLQMVDIIFKEIHEQVDVRRTILEADINKKINQMQSVCLKHLHDLIQEASGKSDLWCMTTKAKLNYYSDKKNLGEIPVDLFQSGGNNNEILKLGERILQELNQSRMDVQLRMEELGQKQLFVDYKGGLDKFLEGLFMLVLKSADNEQVIILRDQSGCSRSMSSVGQSFTKMMVGDSTSVDPFLLRNMNDSSLFQDSFSILQSGKGFPEDQSGKGFQDQSGSKGFQEDLNISQRPSPQKKVSFYEEELTRTTPDKKNGRASTSPFSRRSKTKLSKLPDKYQMVIEALQSDQIETADFTGANLTDEMLSLITPMIVTSTKLRIIKLCKNKISDHGAVALLTAVLAEQNKDQFSVPTNILASVNLSNNIMTDKTVDVVLDLCRNYSDSMHVQSLRSLQMSLNLINAQRVKKKVEELKKIGVNLQT